MGVSDRTLSRRLIHATREASLLRDQSTIDVINGTLDRIAAGLRVGRERQLLALTMALSVQRLRAWHKIQDRRKVRVTHLTLDAVLIGDGSEHP
jgi:hypothetical protein